MYVLGVGMSVALPVVYVAVAYVGRKNAKIQKVTLIFC